MAVGVVRVMELFRLEAVRDELAIKTLLVMCTGEMEIDWRGLKELQLLSDGRSLKRTDDDKILNLAESLMRFGLVNTLQVWFDADGDCYCFDAHHRKKALEVVEEVGVEIPPLPATRCLAKDKLEAKKLLITKESSASWVDVEVIPEYMREVGLDLNIAARTIDLPQFEWGELDEFKETEEEKRKADAVPAVDGKTVVRLGDLIEMGAHRLLCGDSTKAEDVEMLMGGEKADMVFTDPPYGVNYDGGTTKREILKGDHNTDLYGSVCDMSYKYTHESAALYLWHASASVANAIIKSGYEIRCEVIWNKNQAQFGALSAQYKQKHEPAYYCYKKGKTVNWTGPSNEVTVWDVDRANKNEFHPTQKPVQLAVRAINNHNVKIILDFFLGLGSTLIAAEKTGRRCYGMEIAPAYCQVTTQRYVDFTGRDELKINGENVLWSKYKGG
jgi:DNA modification methylase